MTETASLRGGLTFSMTNGPYDGREERRKTNLPDFDLFGEPAEQKHGAKLAEEFVYPPFSVLSARDGWWQERKRQWLALGIQSELGRGGGLLELSEQASEPGLNYYRNRVND